MKKKLINTMLLLTLLTSFLSCSKSNEVLLLPNENSGMPTIVEKGTAELSKGVDPSLVIASLAQEYGLLYDFSNTNKIPIAHPSGASSINIYLVHSLMIPHLYLTFILNNSANIIGLYNIEFSGSNNADTAYDFYVYDPDALSNQFFYGWIGFNTTAPISNHLVVMNTVTVPSDYPYPIFANVTNGMFPLESFTGYNTTPINDTVLSFYAASTFYENFCE